MEQVLVNGAGTSFRIRLAENTSISNSASNSSQANAINITSAAGADALIISAGSISTNNNANSAAISFSGGAGGLNYILNDNGSISGGIAVSARASVVYLINDASPTGNGSITGAINAGADDVASESQEFFIRNNGVGVITGDITTYRSALEVENIYGTINSAISLGNNAGSYIQNSEGGVIVGNITMGNIAQNMFIGTGSVTGTINGAGSLYISGSGNIDGDIGGITPVTRLVLGDTTLTLIDASIHNNSINATTTLINDNTTLRLGTGSFTTALDGAEGAVGILELNANNTIAAGTTLGSTNGLAAVTILNSVAITGNESIKATTTTIGAGGTAAASLI